MEEKDLIYYVKNLFKGKKQEDKPESVQQPVQQPEPQQQPVADTSSGSQPAQQPEPQAAVPPQPVPQPAPAPEPVSVSTNRFNYVDFIEDIRPKILRKIENKYPRLRTYSDYTLLVYIDDSAAYRAAKDNGMAEVIDIYIDSMRGKRFRGVQVLTGPIRPGVDFERVNQMVTIALHRQEMAQQAQMVASISMQYGETSICTIGDEPFVLDTTTNMVWNIGWGRNVMIDGRPRTNHIAMDYKNPQEQDTDIYMISRAHAHIKFRNGNFFLYVDERGTRQAGKRTKLESGSKITELTDVNVGHCLKDGDVIRLNNEYLKFNYNPIE